MVGQAQENPYVGMCFEVSADGTPLGSFAECTGLTVELGTEDYKEGGNNHFVHKLPTYAATKPLTLKIGLSSSTALWDWIDSYLTTAQLIPRRVEVQLMAPGTNGGPLRSWILDGAYPIKWDGPQFNASKGEVVMETLELAHHGITQGS